MNERMEKLLNDGLAQALTAAGVKVVYNREAMPPRFVVPGMEDEKVRLVTLGFLIGHSAGLLDGCKRMAARSGRK